MSRKQRRAIATAIAQAALLVSIDASPKAVLVTALGGPGAYFVGQRFRRRRKAREAEHLAVDA